MEPTIPTGSVAFTRQVDPQTIKAGDIIAFTSPSDSQDTILHRVDSISSTDPLLFKTKGDNNNAIDAWDVMASGVKGKYIFAVPYLGNIAAFIKEPIGFSLIIGLPALLFIILQIFNIKKNIEEEINRKVSQKLSESKKTNSAKTSLKSIIITIIMIGSLISFSSFNIAKAVFSDTVVVSGITISTADFTKPSIPILLSPTNNSLTTSDGLVMDWQDSASYSNPNPVFYIYQSSHFSDFNTLAYQSGYLYNSQIPAPSTPDGIYYWRVKACFSSEYCSDWSEIWKVTVGPPVVSLSSTTFSPNIIELDSAQLNPICQPDVQFEVYNSRSSFTATCLTDFAKLDYELTYLSGDIEKGLAGSINLNGDLEISRDNLVLGTCSSLGEVCVYDQNITNLKLDIILTKEDGQFTQIIKELN